jgi:hypothetical protein
VPTTVIPTCRKWSRFAARIAGRDRRYADVDVLGEAVLRSRRVEGGEVDQPLGWRPSEPAGRAVVPGGRRQRELDGGFDGRLAPRRVAAVAATGEERRGRDPKRDGSVPGRRSLHGMNRTRPDRVAPMRSRASH